MAKVRKGNRELTVAEHKIDDFVAQGYDLIDEKGAVLKKGAPVSLQDYKESYVAAQKEIKEKDEKITQLENQLEEYKATVNGLNDEIKDLNKRIEELNATKQTTKKAVSK